MLNILQIINLILLITLAILLYKNHENKLIIALFIICVIIFICGVLIP